MSLSVSRAARIALLLSLALNLALGTWLLAAAPWRHAPGAGPRHAPVPQLLELRALRRGLPDARQQVIDAAFAAHRGELRERLGALFAARRAVRLAMRAEPYDRAALDDAFAQLRRAETAAAETAQALLGDVLERLTPQERAQFAEMMPQRGRGRGGPMRRERGSDAPRPTDD